ncbi:outer membrane protein assembly factor BamB [Moraxella caviae]|uniref:Outer membrane protein assembly factor BamB n=1 Tax=Moraxella caviae TaxID=34060 RepID=A0A1T0A660_9GAMM|nr:outer membrane protein assembly factor BamB [Moraxella caviae]OOR91204.1 outer membrane protein assembly factor BamB [Moraxella caviae]STZ13769.1 Lipoprotein yfgL precursor [Moraxella caviae]VEW12662.1 Lipoprotein yfgL precursor [Moraxella caviae]
MRTRFLSTALVAVLAAVAVTGCGKGIKAEPKKPAKLVQIAEPVAVLSPVFSTSLEQGRWIKGNRASSKDVVDLQVAALGDVLIAGSRGGVVSAYKNGNVLWTTDVGGSITSGVAADADSGVVIVGTRAGKVSALDAATGALRWQSDLSTASLTPALISGNRVLLSGNDNVLYGLDLNTGDKVWQFNTQTTDISVRGAARPLGLDRTTALFGTADGRIHALNPSTGTPLWTRRVGLATGGSAVERLHDVDGTPLVVGSHLYVTSYSGQFAGFDMATGRTMFVIGDVASAKSPAVLGDAVVVASTDGKLTAFHRVTGEKLWENDALKHRKLTNPVAVGERLAVGDLDGVVHVFDSAGKIVSRSNTKGALTSLQTIGNRLYAQSATGVVSVWQF